MCRQWRNEIRTREGAGRKHERSEDLTYVRVAVYMVIGYFSVVSFPLRLLAP